VTETEKATSTSGLSACAVDQKGDAAHWTSSRTQGRAQIQRNPDFFSPAVLTYTPDRLTIAPRPAHAVQGSATAGSLAQAVGIAAAPLERNVASSPGAPAERAWVSDCFRDGDDRHAIHGVPDADQAASPALAEPQASVAREWATERHLAAVQPGDSGVREWGLEYSHASKANAPSPANLRVHLAYTVAERLVVPAA
jgi:hypothetical protein